MWMNRRAPACLGSAEHTPGALDVDAIPGVRSPPQLDEGGTMDHDLSASDIGSGHRIDIAPKLARRRPRGSSGRWTMTAT